VLGGDTLISAGVSPEQEISMIFETLKTRGEGAVLFVDTAAPPMNLLGPEFHEKSMRASYSPAATGRGF
jgi:hypothetical protein